MTTGIGQTLREAREQRGLSLDDAADDTRIRASHLAAIEQEDFERLGGEVYVRGFIRSYARVLGVDPEPLLQQHRPAADPAPAEAPAPVTRQPLEGAPRRGLGVAVAVLALAGIVGLALLSDDGPGDPVGPDRDPVAEQDDPDEGGGDPGDQPGSGAAPATPAPTPSPTASPDHQPAGASDEGVRVRLETVDRDVWLRALVDGDQVLSATLPPGSTEAFQGDQEIRLRLGDAGAVQLTVNGQSQGSLGASGEPVWITVDADGEVSTG